jgi:hypothetical protein
VDVNKKGVNRKLCSCKKKKVKEVEINQQKNVIPEKKGGKLRSVSW